MSDLNANFVEPLTLPKPVSLTEAAQYGQTYAQNMNALKQQAQGAHDDQILTQAAQMSGNSSDPDFGTKVVQNAQSLGLSGKALIDLQQNQLKFKSDNLTLQSNALKYADSVLALNSDQRAQHMQYLQEGLEDMQGIEDFWQSHGKSPDGQAAVITMIDANLSQEVKDGVLTTQQASALRQKAIQNGKFNYQAFDEVFQQMKANNQAVSNKITAQQTAAQSAQAGITEKQSETTKNLAQANAAGVHTQTVQRLDANTGQIETQIITLDAKGKVIGSDVVQGAKNAGSTAGEMTQRGSAVQSAFAIDQIPIPAGVAGFGASGKAQFFNTLASQHPDMSPEQIAQDAKAHKLDMLAATKEVQTAAQKASSVAGSVASIFGPQGEADTLIDSAQKAGLSDIKAKNWGQAEWTKATSNPNWAAYVSANKELVSSMAQVFSRGGASSVNAQQEAQQMFPLNSSIDELNSRLAVSRQIAAAVERGNQSVITAITKGEALDQIVASVHNNTGAGANQSQSNNGLPPGWTVTEH